MNLKENLDYKKQCLKNKKDFQVIYDGDDFGVYHYNELKDRYEGIIGHIPLNTMIRAITDETYFIQVIPNE